MILSSTLFSSHKLNELHKTRSDKNTLLLEVVYFPLKLNTDQNSSLKIWNFFRIIKIQDEFKFKLKSSLKKVKLN